jgi:hypothetical protein
VTRILPCEASLRPMVSSAIRASMLMRDKSSGVAHAGEFSSSDAASGWFPCGRCHRHR